MSERGDSPAHNWTLSSSTKTAALYDCVQLENTLSPTSAWTVRCSCCLSAWALPNQKNKFVVIILMDGWVPMHPIEDKWIHPDGCSTS